MGESPSPLRQDPSFRPPELKDAHARAPNSRRASPKYRCTGDPSQSSYRLSIFPSNALAPSSTRSSRGGSLSDPCPQSVLSPTRSPKTPSTPRRGTPSSCCTHTELHHQK